jgi:hypothetical protein
VPDLEAAITALSAEIPELKDVILWGGCNAASAIMMHAWRFPLVSGIIASNPYMGKHNLAEKAKWLHFANRLRQASFWKKLFSGQFTISAYLPSISALKKKRSSKPVKEIKPQENKPVSNTLAAPSSANNQPGYVLEQMLNGLHRYKGQCLMFMSENSIQSNEFKVLLKSSRQWRKVMKQPEFSMLNLPGADQNISSVDSQKTVRALTKEWLIKSGYAQK